MLDPQQVFPRRRGFRNRKVELVFRLDGRPVRVVQGTSVGDFEPVAFAPVALEVVIRGSREVHNVGTGMPDIGVPGDTVRVEFRARSVAAVTGSIDRNAETNLGAGEDVGYGCFCHRIKGVATTGDVGVKRRVDGVELKVLVAGRVCRDIDGKGGCDITVGGLVCVPI